MKPIALLFVIFVISPLSVFAKVLVLKADHMIDVENGKLIDNPIVILQNNKIIEVGVAGKVAIPEGSEVIDLKGQTILPGLMDMHVHLNGDADSHGYRSLAHSVPRSTIFGVKNARKTLMAGFTAARSLGAPGYSDVALRDGINDGDIVGPRLFVSGPALGVTGGHCDNNLLPFEYHAFAEGVANGPWAVREKVRQNAKYGVDLIKYCATGGVLSKGTKVGAQQYSQEEMNALVAEAKLLGFTVAAHAHGTDGIKSAIKAGVTSVEHASFLDKEAIKLAKKYGTYLSMDIYTTEYILGEGEAAGILQESLDKERVVGTKQRESFSNAVKAGVKMVFGTDAGVYPHGDNGKQFSRMVRFGMTPIQAIQAATINPATMLMQQQNIGSISVGKYADIISVKGNPLQDISVLENVQTVIKDGVIYKQ
jgi:imidazolonepropionase-like amidohydrolase